MKKNFYFLVFLIILLGSQVSRSQSVFSDFTYSREGWVVYDVNNHLDTDCFISDGGNPGGYISEDNEVSTGPRFFAAPLKFLGDRSGAYNKSFSFDMMLSDTTMDTTVAFKQYADLRISGSGLDLFISLPHDTLPWFWQHFQVLFNENSGWHLNSLTGPAPTYQNMIDVLSNVTSIRIKGKYSDNAGTGGIDNVFLSASSPISTFDTDYEGWRVIGDVQNGSGMPNYHSTGGHPSSSRPH